MYPSKQTASYDENKRFLSRSYISQEEFAEEYRKFYYEKTKAKELYLQILIELERAISLGNIDSFKKFNCLICYISKIENEAILRTYYNQREGPIGNTNPVILACKHNQDEILKHVFNSSKISNKLCVNYGKDAITADDEDDTCHNAFYYAVRSGNVELLDTLINEWPENYFHVNLGELDKILSRAYEELKLRNVPLSDEMEIFVQNKLINLRFFSNVSEQVQNVDTTLSNIKERIDLVLDNICLLIANVEVDERYLFIASIVAQNVHILKRQLKSTYDRLPWEEIEFCLVSFISYHVKQQEINIFYYATLDKDKISYHLENFAKKLKDEKSNIEGIDLDKLAELPKLKREKVVVKIISNYPQFEELYNDYEQIRDAYSLKKMSTCVDLALLADSEKKEGQLAITRSIQVIGEYLKNTLESSNLSNTTSEYLLVSLQKDTRKIMMDLRNSLSHAHSLCTRMEIESSAGASFFVGIQNDIRKLGAVIIEILHHKKFKVVEALLQNISDSKDPNKIKETADVLNNIQINDMILEVFKTQEQRKVEELINELKNKINKTNYEAQLFKGINDIINFKNSRSMRFNSDYILESMGFLFEKLRIDSSSITDRRNIVDIILHNIKPNLGSNDLKEVAKLVVQISKSVELRVQDEHVTEIINKIFCIATFDASKIEGIEELKNKLDSDKGGYKIKGQGDILKLPNYEKRLDEKLFILKDILFKNGLNDQLVEKYPFYKKSEKLQSAVEMLLLDIMSILGSSKNLENNLLFLDDNIPLLTGKCLRNYLAHGDTLVDVLLTDPLMTVLLNAKKLTAENINKNKIGKLVKDDPSKLKEKYNRSLVTITNQGRMFIALEEGNLEDLKNCIKQGADVKARSINLWSTLHFAAKGSNLEVVKFLFDQNLNAGVKDVDNKNPLHIAASFGSYEIVRFFIEDKGMVVNCLDNQKRTPLLLAAQNGHKHILELLLKMNADCSIKDRNGFTPLHYAVKNDHRDVVKVLLKKEKTVDMNRTASGLTLLHIASVNNRQELVNFLLNNNANVNATGYNGWTPLHYAAKSNNRGIAHALIKKGADTNAKSMQGDTPLHLAAEDGNIDVMKVLLNNGADINAQSSRNSDTPLHLAAEGGHKNVVKFLLDAGADANAEDRYKFTPLHTSIFRNDNKQVVEVLTQKGANVSSKSWQGDTPLHFAAIGGYKEVIKVLIKKGANINIKNDQNRAPLELAVLHDRVQAVKTLLQYKGVNFNAKGTNDFTVLHTAAQVGNHEIVKCLIEMGADISAETSEGHTPLHLAAGGGHKEVINVLLDKGADVNSKCSEGFSSLHCAAENGCKEVVDIFMENGANINATDYKNNITPLYLSALHDNLDILEALLNKGANVNVKNSYNSTPLHAVALIGNRKVVEALIKNGANFDATDNDNYTPLHLAASKGRNNVVDVLLKQGANINAKNSKDGTPIELAVLNNHLHVVRTLLNDKRFNINTRDNNGYTVLHIAAQLGKLEIVKCLTEEGADVNIQTIHGNTPLHLSAANKFKEITEVLIAKGADVNIKDHYSRTAEELESAIAFRNLYGSGSSNVDITSNINDIKSKELFEQILTIQEKYHDTNHLKVAEVLIQLGKIDRNLGHNQKAKESLERALKIQEIHYGIESPEVAGTLVHLGIVYENLGNPQKHKELLKRALKIQKTYYGLDHIEIATTLENLSIAYGNLGNPRKKMELLERALPIKEKHYGRNHPDIATALMNLGNTYGALGDIQTQKKLLENALNIQNICFSSNHISIAFTLHNLGTACQRLADLPGAKNLFERALVIKEKHYGIDHFTLASTLSNLGTIYGELGDNQKEKELQERALRIQERHFGPNNFKLAGTLVNLGLVYGKLGNFQKKKELCEQALYMAEEHYGPDNFETAKFLINLGTALGDIGDNQKTKELLKRALTIQKKHYGPSHFEVAETLVYLSTSYGRLSDYQKEKELLEQALAIKEKYFGSDHVQLVTALMKLSIAHRKLGDLQKEKKLIEQALTIQERHYGPDHFVVAKILENLGAVNANLGNKQKAIEWLERALDIQQRHFGSDHFEVVTTLQNLGNVYGMLGNPAKQKKLFEKALSISKKYYGPTHPNVLDISRKVEIVSLLLDRSEVSNVQDIQKDIHTAAGNGDIRTVRHLIKYGVDVNDKDVDGRTPLHHAVNNGHIDIVNILLNNKSDVTQVTNKGNTPLHTAVSKGYKEIVEVLLLHVSCDKLSNFINAKTTAGCTASLHVAAKNGYMEIVKCLLKHGATYNVENKGNETPLDLAKDRSVINLLKLIGELFEYAKNGNIEIISKLKSIKPDELKAATNARNNKGNTLLQVAIANRHRDIASKLLTMLKKPN